MSKLLRNRLIVSIATGVRVAFPRYRAYLHNATKSGAVVSLFVYRTR